MKVVSTYCRPHRQFPPKKSRELILQAGFGIKQDCHASGLSPRQILIVSTGAYKYCKVPAGSLRENILVDTDDLFLESGSLVRIGTEALVRITFECEPCGKLNRVRTGLSRDVRGKRGYLGRVIQGGVIKPGDSCTVRQNVFKPFSASWQERVIEIVRMIPTDDLISYGGLAHLAGVPKSYCRVFPRLLRSKEDLPWQRVVPSNHLNLSSVVLASLGSQIFADDNAV